jgi:hypothetical protein
VAASLTTQLSGYWKLGSDIASGRVTREALSATLLEMKQEGLAQGRKVFGADMALSNYPRGGRTKKRKANIGFDVRNDGATFRFRPGGLWRIAEDGADRHRIGQTRKGAKGQTITRRGRALMPTGGGEAAYGPFSHPGSASLGSPLARTLAKYEQFWFNNFTRTVYRRL